MISKAAGAAHAGASEFTDVALTSDHHWRSTVSAGLRVLSWRSGAPDSMAAVADEAVTNLRFVHHSDFARIEKDLDFSKGSRQGAVRITRPTRLLAEQIALRLQKEAGKGPRFASMRTVVLVALYTRALDGLAESQLTLFRRMVAYLRRALADPATVRQVRATLNLSDKEIELFLRSAGEIRPADGNQAFLRIGEMVQAAGLPSASIIHAATVASSDEDFFDIVAATTPRR